MSKRSVSSEEDPGMRPALTPEARENQLIALATNLAEQQLRDGTASSQVITHYLKLGTERYKLENSKLEHENKLLEVKKESIEAAKNQDALYAEALSAMRTYQGDV